MATNSATLDETVTETDSFRDAIDAIVGGDILIDLDKVARILHLPSKDAAQRRIDRGTLPVRVIRPGGQTARTLVPAADVYALLGLDWHPPATKVTARILPDGSLHIATVT